MTVRALLTLTLFTLGSTSGAAQEALAPYTVAGEAIPLSLTGKPGDPASGRAIVVKRENT